MSERREIEMPSTQNFFNQWGIVEAVRTGNTVWVSGQVGWDQQLNPAADLEGQARLAFQNLKAVLAKAGAEPRHLTRLLLFFVDTGGQGSLMDMAQVVFRVKKEVIPDARPAATGTRVLELAHPQLMLEVEATAVID